MRPNLIQTYLNNMPQVPPDKKDRNLDIEYVLSNRTFIKPLPSKGHLINRGILSAPAAVAKNIAYDTKSFVKAARGKANDYEAGKVNDIGMKLGGLMIAGYLMTRKQAPLAKAMEFVGLASFFAAMSIWPKIALQWPAQLVHGFNIRQKYEDSFGREKLFFQDPQYLAWSLFSDQKINKIGDWMGVPKDMNNRRDFIQEKMKKTAIQNNTMWMWTAGFATPVLSALICNACEKPITNLIGKHRAKKADNMLLDLNNASVKFKDSAALDELEEFIAENKDKKLNSDLVKKIKANLTKGFDGVTAQAISDDLDDILGLNNKKYYVDYMTLENITANTRKALETLVTPAQADRFLPDTDSLQNLLKDDFLNKELSETDVKKLLGVVGAKIRRNVRSYNSSIDFGKVDERRVIDRLFNLKMADNPIAKAIKPSSKLSDSLVETLRSTANVLTEFKARNAVLDEYIYLKAAAAPQTVLANAWNDFTHALPKLFNISQKEIAETRFDRKLTGELLRNKIEKIVASDTEYDALVRAIVEKIKVFDRSPAMSENYINAVNSVFERFPNVLQEKGLSMPNTVNRINGNFGSLKNVQKDFGANRVLGIRSSLYRLLNTLDFYKRIADAGKISDEYIAALHSGMPKAVKEEIVEFAKKLSISGTTSDYITKFFELRNPKPNSDDKNQIKSVAGKVEYKFLGENVPGGKVDIPQDKMFFHEIMKLLYENKMHPHTVDIVSNSGSALVDELAEYRRTFINEIGNAEYFFKPHHTTGAINKNTKSYRQFLLVGLAPDQMLNMTTKSIYNTRKWLKMFGGFGAGLLGVTVLSQFFFGKMKLPGGQKND